MLELTLGLVQTGSQNQRNSNAPTFDDRSIEWTLSMEEEARKAAEIDTQERVHNFGIIFWESK